MQISDFFYGSLGRIYSSSCIIIILVMMCIVSLRLFLSRRKKAYLSLTVSLMFIIVQYLLLIGFALRDGDYGNSSEYLIEVLQVIAFILINMGIFQLYNLSRRKEFTYFYTFILLTVLIASIRFFAVSRFDHPTLQVLHFHNIWLDVYLLVLTFLCFYLVSPFIGQHIKYQIGLTLYLTIQLAHISNTYIFEHEMPFLTMLQYFLPIVFYIILFMMIFERVVDLLQAIYNSSIKDGLTGLYNRHYFLNRITQYIQQGVMVSVIFGDIDNFKRLNDTKGHQTGDKVLKQVANIFMEECTGVGNSSGIVGRYGGEELVALLTDTSLRVENVAEQIRKRVEKESIATISLGFAKYKKGMTPGELIVQADKAMYQSKKTGKNKVMGYPI